MNVGATPFPHLAMHWPREYCRCVRAARSRKAHASLIRELVGRRWSRVAIRVGLGCVEVVVRFIQQTRLRTKPRKGQTRASELKSHLGFTVNA